MLGTGDVDFMDPNVSYYTVGYLNLRMWDRQLLSYPAVPGQTTNPVPDLATQIPTTANGGITARRDRLQADDSQRSHVEHQPAPARSSPPTWCGASSGPATRPSPLAASRTSRP